MISCYIELLPLPCKQKLVAKRMFPFELLIPIYSSYQINSIVKEDPKYDVLR